VKLPASYWYTTPLFFSADNSSLPPFYDPICFLLSGLFLLFRHGRAAVALCLWCTSNLLAHSGWTVERQLGWLSCLLGGPPVAYRPPCQEPYCRHTDVQQAEKTCVDAVARQRISLDCRSAMGEDVAGYTPGAPCRAEGNSTPTVHRHGTSRSAGPRRTACVTLSHGPLPKQGGAARAGSHGQVCRPTPRHPA
jgi:hypothetical protein